MEQPYHLLIALSDAQFFQEHLPSALKGGRIKFVEHDFFAPQPIKGAPIYFMRYIIHDWPDTDAIQILTQICEAMSPTSRLLVCDRIILPSYRGTQETEARGVEGEVAPQPLLANWADAASSGADLLMMLNFNAKERTKEEFEGLFKEAGLVLEKLYYQNGAVGILQCARVD
jgi:O-methyltransferase domain